MLKKNVEQNKKYKVSSNIKKKKKNVFEKSDEMNEGMKVNEDMEDTEKAEIQHQLLHQIMQ